MRGDKQAREDVEMLYAQVALEHSWSAHGILYLCPILMNEQQQEDMIDNTSFFGLALFNLGFNVRTCPLGTCIGPAEVQMERCLRFLAGEDSVADGSIIRNIVSQDTAALEDQVGLCIGPAR